MRQITDRAVRRHHAEPPLRHQLQVDPPPAHDTVHRRIWTRLDDLVEPGRQFRAQRARARRLGAVRQTGDALGPVAMHPAAQSLALDAGSLDRIAATAPVRHR